MAQVLQSSPFLKLLTFIGGSLLLLVVVTVFTSKEQAPLRSGGQSSQQLTVKSNGDREAADDTISESLGSLSEQVGTFDKEFQSKNVQTDTRIKALEAQLASVNDDNQITPEQIATIVDELVQKRLSEELAGNASMSVEQSSDSIFNDYVDDTQPKETVKLPGYVIEDEAESSVDSNSYEWTYPVGEGSEESGLLGGFVKKAENGFDLTKELASNTKTKFEKIQYATIDKESILYDAIAITELVGVVADSSTVKAPFRFKVELGQDNLATSGVNMPHIAEMRMSGYVVGEWVKGCVQGIITSATFVFEDGTISNAEIGKTSKEQGNQQGNQGQIAYITDQYGSPCIKGQKYSDLGEYAAVTGGVSALAGIGSAVANAQYDTMRDGSGSNTVFTGDMGANIVGQSIEQGASAFNQVMMQRYKNIRDVVVVPAGQYVTVQLSQQLHIDYDPKGRKILNENFEQELNEYYEQENNLYSSK